MIVKADSKCIVRQNPFPGARAPSSLRSLFPEIVLKCPLFIYLKGQWKSWSWDFGKWCVLHSEKQGALGDLAGICSEFHTESQDHMWEPWRSWLSHGIWVHSEKDDANVLHCKLGRIFLLIKWVQSPDPLNMLCCWFYACVICLYWFLKEKLGWGGNWSIVSSNVHLTQWAVLIQTKV
jgi:hypothetical protein